MAQALGAGALRGEEFNAVNEAAPRLMKALADGLGVPVGKLKQLAEQGLLTTDVVTRALESQADVSDHGSASMHRCSGSGTIFNGFFRNVDIYR